MMRRMIRVPAARGVRSLHALISQLEGNAPVTPGDRVVRSAADEFGTPKIYPEMKAKYGEMAQHANPA